MMRSSGGQRPSSSVLFPGFAGVEGVELVVEPKGFCTNHWMVSLRLTGANLNIIINAVSKFA